VHVVIAEPAVGTDAALVAGSCERPEEFAALFDRHAGMVYRYASQRLGSQVASPSNSPQPPSPSNSNGSTLCAKLK
jgi:hypothetical protein